MHIPVLLKEVIHYLDPQPNQNFIDCTIGGGGHSEAILQRNGPQGKLLGIELDPLSVRIARRRLKQFGRRVILVQDNFSHLKKIAHKNNFDEIKGILLDLGLSSITLEKSGRGFSFEKDESLDMRFDPDNKLTASQILNQYSEDGISKILSCYGEIPQAKRIAQSLVNARSRKGVKTTKDLVKIIAKIQNLPSRLAGKKILALVFQALRIEVNKELKNLRQVLPQALEILEPNGRLVVISFHSLEDRIVKKFFQGESRDCLCPPETPVCVCNHNRQIKILTKKPIKPTQREITKNPRARSAKLRSAQKI